MSERYGPVIFASVYTAGVILTIFLAIAYSRMGDAVLRVGLAILQITVTLIAIFSAWALQEHKRVQDAKDVAESAASGVLAMTEAVTKQATWVSSIFDSRKISRSGCKNHADMIEDELKALTAVPLATLKPPSAAASLVTYRQSVRYFLVALRTAAEPSNEDWTDLIAYRLNDLRIAEYNIYYRLQREVPERLRNLPVSSDVVKSYEGKLKPPFPVK